MNQNWEIVAAGMGSIYEVLLIILVVILIFNGLLRQKILNKVNNRFEASNQAPKSPEKKVKIRRRNNEEYVDYEEIKD